MNQFKLKIISLEKTEIEKKIYKIHLKATNGDLVIYANHTPIIANVNASYINFLNIDGNDEEYYVGKSTFIFNDNELTLLTDFFKHKTDNVDPEKIYAQLLNKKEKETKNSTLFEFEEQIIKLE